MGALGYWKGEKGEELQGSDICPKTDPDSKKASGDTGKER